MTAATNGGSATVQDLFRTARVMRERGYDPADIHDDLRERFCGRVNEDAIGEAVTWAAEIRTPRTPSLGSVSSGGEEILELLRRPIPEPVAAGIPVSGHLWLVVAPPMSGKSSLAYWLAMATAAGIAPWEGAPELGPAPVLLLSLDEATEQAARRINSLALLHPAGPLPRYVRNLRIVGPDRDVPPELLDALRFDDQGLATLAGWLEAEAAAGRPFGLVIVDAYADMLPLEESENDNATATRIVGALERIAVRSGAALMLLHHTGKPARDQGDSPPDVRFAGRGASALAAKARVASVLEAVPGFPHLRRLRTVTNLSRSPKPVTWAVSSPEADAEELIYFRRHDALAEYPPGDYLGSEPITTSDLAWQLADQEPQPGKRPPGESCRLAAQLRQEWLRGGLIDVLDGPRNSKLLKLRGAP